jgi:hypothetical protein
MVWLNSIFTDFIQHDTFNRPRSSIYVTAQPKRDGATQLPAVDDKQATSGIVIQLSKADTKLLEAYRLNERTEEGYPLGVGAAAAKLISEALQAKVAPSSTRP